MNQGIHFAVLMLKSSFNFLRAIMKCQKCSESEAVHEIGELLRYAKDRTGRSKTDWQSAIQFAQINICESLKF